MCVWAHRLMGEGWAFSPDTTSHTHPQRAGGERQEERGLLQLACFSVYSWQAKLARALSRHENELVSDQGP